MFAHPNKVFKRGNVIEEGKLKIIKVEDLLQLHVFLEKKTFYPIKKIKSVDYERLTTISILYYGYCMML